MRRRNAGWIVGLVVAVFCTTGFAEPTFHPETETDFLEQYRQAIAKNPVGVTFTIQTESGKTHFYLRELIPLTILFTSSIPDRYKIDSPFSFLTRFSNKDHCYITPCEDISDPEDIIRKVDSVFYCDSISMGGPNQGSILSEKPYSKTIWLNDRIRFGKPGKYRLFITSNRVDRLRDQPGKDGYQYEPVFLTSNILELEIAPQDAEWEHRRFLAATQTIQSGSDYVSLQDAYRELRYLETEEALEPLIQGLIHKRHSQNYSRLCQKGLYGSPFRKTALERMEAIIDDPTVHLHRVFFDTITILRFNIGDPEPLPYYPYPDRDEQRVLQYYSKLRWGAYQSIFSGYIQRFCQVRSNQDAITKARSLMTAVETFCSRYDSQFESWQKEIIRQFPGTILSAFHLLPTEEQIEVINYYTRFLDVPEMLPIYRDVFKNPPENPYDHSSNLVDSVLEQISRIDPGEGRKLILEEIQKPLPKASIKILGTLPEKELPGMDKILVENLADWFNHKERNHQYGDEERMVTVARLIERYASPGVLDLVYQVYLEPKVNHDAYWDRVGVLLLSYILRVDESLAKVLLDELVTEKKDSALSTLIRISEIRSFPILEQYVIPFLKSEDWSAVHSAVIWVERFGTIASQQSLWDCLERWHRNWVGREEELIPNDPKEVIWYNANLGSDLLRALIFNPSWGIDLDDLKRMESLSLTPSMKNFTKEWMEKYSKPIRLSIYQPAYSFDNPNYFRITLSEYPNYTPQKTRLKIAHFPKGAVFEYYVSKESPDANADGCLRELRNYIEGLGMILREMKRTGE